MSSCFHFTDQCTVDDLRVNKGTIAPSTASEESFELLRNWLEKCPDEHAACDLFQEQNLLDPYVPERLVFIPATGKPRLVLVDPELAQDKQYATLSHCWDSSKFPFRLLTSNLAALQSEIPLQKLPQTFLDAFEICRRIDVQYLWIDALCIIWNNRLDKEAYFTTAKMGSIYASSYLNIAAARGPDDSYGCFSYNRNTDLVKPLRLSIKHGKDTSQVYATGYDFSWDKRFYSSPLSRRPWTFQERYVAPRTVYYHDDQLQWECQYLGNETFPGIELPLNHRAFPKVPLDSAFMEHRGERLRVGMHHLDIYPELGGSFDVWNQIVWNYTRAAEFSCTQEKLFAIAGLAQKFGTCIGDTGYVAGMWIWCFAHQLLWRVATFPKVVHDPKQTPSYTSKEQWLAAFRGYGVPSWSWASVEHGRIAAAALVTRPDDHDIIVKIPEMGVYPVYPVRHHISNDDHDPFSGPINGGRLRVKGRLAREGLYL
ncbi:Heterokaryon incompatibility protein (HET) domain containing protein, partial [Naviculisporaceae sp. PSN 640]